jgi:hypothetical protein
MAHALFMPDNYGKNKAPLRICNGYCSSTVTMVRQTPLSVKLYVYVVFPVLLGCVYVHSVDAG